MLTSLESVIVQKVVQVLNPMIRLYALYVLFHGHYSPGGGFQAGILLGASFILPSLVGINTKDFKLTQTTAVMMGSFGLLIYVGIGVIGLIRGGHFLDYSLLPLPGMDLALRRSIGILGVETGICLTVTSIILSIFYSLSGHTQNIPDEVSD